jgi:hypothetical protein
MSSSAAVIIATAGDNAPDAISRLRLLGCARSYSRSRTSFTRYIADAVRQNAANAMAAAPTADGLPVWCASTTGAKSNTFFVQCTGRRERRSASIARDDKASSSLLPSAEGRRCRTRMRGPLRISQPNTPHPAFGHLLPSRGEGRRLL